MLQHTQQSAAGTGLPHHTYPAQSQRTLEGMQHIALVFAWEVELRFGSAGHFSQMVPLSQELQTEQGWVWNTLLLQAWQRLWEARTNSRH